LQASGPLFGETDRHSRQGNCSSEVLGSAEIFMREREVASKTNGLQRLRCLSLVFFLEVCVKEAHFNIGLNVP